MLNDCHKQCPPGLALERYSKGELGGGTSQVWQEHVEQCAECSRQLKRMAAETASLQGSRRWQQLAYQLHENRGVVTLPKYAPTIRGLGIVGAVAAAACAVLMLIWPQSADHSAARVRDHLTAKGNAQITVTLVRDRRVVAFEEGRSLLRPGDMLQFDWISARPGYLAVFLQEAGAPVVQLFPEQGGCMKIDAGKVSVGAGLLVDDSSKDAVIWGFFADQDFDVSSLISGFKKGKPPNETTFDGQIVQVGLNMLGSPSR